MSEQPAMYWPGRDPASGAEIERCASCGHGEDEHLDELQELDYDYRPIGAPYSACEGCLIDDSPNSAHAFEAAVRR